MTSGIQENPPASVARLMVRLDRAELQCQLFRFIEIAGAEVQVDLLWHFRARPLGWPVSVNSLESEVTAGVITESDELRNAEDLAHPGQGTVEARQCLRVGAVQGHSSQFSAWHELPPLGPRATGHGPLVATIGPQRHHTSASTDGTVVSADGPRTPENGEDSE